MTDQDKRNFMKLIDSIMEMYSQPEVELSLMKVWFTKLQEFDFQTVCKAFNLTFKDGTAHNALFDIVQTYKLFYKIQNLVDIKDI